MTIRIAIWALAGIIVAAGWGLYAYAVHGAPLGEWTIVAITIPLVPLIRRSMVPISVYETVAINAVTYALIGLFLELIARGWRVSRMRLHSR